MEGTMNPAPPIILCHIYLLKTEEEKNRLLLLGITQNLIES